MKLSLYRYFLAVLSVATLALFYGCSISLGDRPGGNLPEMQFNVRDSLLGELVKEPALGMEFKPPKGWSRVDQRLIDSARNVAMQQVGVASDQGEQVRLLFIDSLTNSALAIVKVDSFQAAEYLADSSITVRNYIAKLRAANPSLKIDTDLYRRGSFRIHQVRSAAPASVTVRMIFDNIDEEGAPVFALNWVLPTSQYSAKAYEVESSVGSLQPLSSIQ